jgi:hypothetical protein
VKAGETEKERERKSVYKCYVWIRNECIRIYGRSRRRKINTRERWKEATKKCNLFSSSFIFFFHSLLSFSHWIVQEMRKKRHAQQMYICICAMCEWYKRKWDCKTAYGTSCMWLLLYDIAAYTYSCSIVTLPVNY